MRPEQAKAAICGNAQAVIRRARPSRLIESLHRACASAGAAQAVANFGLLADVAAQTRPDRPTAAPCPSPSSSSLRPRSASASARTATSRAALSPKLLHDLCTYYRPRLELVRKRVRQPVRPRYTAERVRELRTSHAPLPCTTVRCGCATAAPPNQSLRRTATARRARPRDRCEPCRSPRASPNHRAHPNAVHSVASAESVGATHVVVDAVRHAGSGRHRQFAEAIAPEI